MFLDIKNVFLTKLFLEVIRFYTSEDLKWDALPFG